MLTEIHTRSKMIQTIEAFKIVHRFEAFTIEEGVWTSESVSRLKPSTHEPKLIQAIIEGYGEIQILTPNVYIDDNFEWYNVLEFMETNELVSVDIDTILLWRKMPFIC